MFSDEKPGEGAREEARVGGNPRSLWCSMKTEFRAAVYVCPYQTLRGAQGDGFEANP